MGFGGLDSLVQSVAGGAGGGAAIGGPWGAIAGGAIGLGGALLQNQWSADAASHANSFTERMINQQEGFQTAMSNSAYQRGMVDMRAAGLNPMLAYMQGGASTPSGSMGTGAVPTVQNAVGAGLNSALDLMRQQVALRQAESQIRTNDSVQRLQDAQASATLTNADFTGLKSTALKSQLSAIEREAKNREKRAGAEEPFIESDPARERINQAIGTITNAASVLKPRGRVMPPGTVPMDPSTGEMFP